MTVAYVVTAPAVAHTSVGAAQALDADQSLTDLVRESQLLGSLGKREIERLAHHSSIVEFAEGALVSAQDSPVSHVRFGLEGRAKAELSPPARSAFRAVLSFLGPGDAIGLLSIVDGAAHSASVIALTPIKLLSVPVEALAERYDEHPEWHQMLLRLAVSRARVGNEWLQALI